MQLRPEILKLLDSSIPFLSPSGQRIVRSTQSLAELIQSPAGIKAMNTLNMLAVPRDVDTADTTAVGSYNPFSLFLVFYLLVLSTDYSHHAPKTVDFQGSGAEPELLLLNDSKTKDGGEAEVNPT